MIKNILKYGLLFIICLELQVLLFDRIYFSGYLNIYFYVLFILLLPINTSRSMGMLLAFVLGISVDMFSNTPGMHASAAVFMAFLRPSILRFLSPVDGYELGMEARVSILGVGWFIRYSMVLILAHHTWLLYLEAFSISLFFFTLLKVLLSTFATGFIIFLSQFLIYRK
jgi:rod shape-determining protein MreD